MDAEAPYAGLLQRLSNTNNSNEARLKLLERRLTGELPSPRSLTFDDRLHQSDLDDVSSSRLFRPESPRQLLHSDAAKAQPEVHYSSKKRKVSPNTDQDLARQRPQPARSPPFRPVTNQKCITSPVAKHSPSGKSPALASPLSARLMQKNTINKYFSTKGNISSNGCLPIDVGTQTHVSFQEQEESMQRHLLTAFRTAEEAK